MLKIIPGILEKNWQEIERKIELIKPFTNVIHVDIIDGKLAPNTTFLDPEPFKKYSDEVFFEVQMIVEEPLSYVEKFAKAGFKRFIAQIESLSDQKKFIDYARKFGEAGLGIDASTSLDNFSIDLNYPDCFLLMSVKAGFSGQSFLPETREKLKELKRKTNKPIEIDGGVNDEIIPIITKLGAKRAVVNSFLFNSKNIEEEFRKLQELGEIN